VDAILGYLRSLWGRATSARLALLLFAALCVVAGTPATIQSSPGRLGHALTPDIRKATAWEEAWNPFGDPWSLKGRRNPSIPIGAGTTTYTIQGPTTPETPPDDEIQ
jgi:hypothetical protein